MEHIISSMPSDLVSGKFTASSEAAKVKSNLEMSHGARRTELGLIVKAALLEHQEFRSFSLARRILTPQFACYEQGMCYGNHIDAAVFNIHAENDFRTDLSVTIFLSSPRDYEGGELVIVETSREIPIKFDLGDAVIYPSSKVHRVNTVTAGVRRVAITWVQSYVRDHDQREVLYMLTRVGEKVRESCPAFDGALDLSYIYNNLLRMWSDV